MAKSKLEYARGAVVASKYEIIDLIDESPLGNTYRAKHIESGRYVRLTLLDPKLASADHKQEVIASFKQARELAKADRTLQLGELNEYQGVAYYTTEDFDGRSLREIILEYRAAGKLFDVREAAQITIQILEALRPLHAAGQIHRALRPENVLVSIRRTGPRGENVVASVRLTGLGWWDLVPTGTLAEDEYARGEAQYLAPELKSFNPEPSQRGDIYSVGVMFYELLTGTAPVGTFQLPRRRRPDLPKHVDNVIELALAHAPDDRYPTIRDFAADVKRIFQGAAVVEERPQTHIPPAMWAVGAAAVMTLGFAVWNSASDPIQDALRADYEIRKALADQHPRPEEAAVRELLAESPSNMAYVPSGPYLSGKLRQETFFVKTPEPVAEVKHLEAFLIDMFEYPNQLNAPPQSGVSFADAERLCAEAGKRLCTADEFEKACKGPLNYAYGYGDSFDQDFCGGGNSSIHRSGTQPECKSGWGAYDIAGNFVEWTSTRQQGKGTRVVVKGGDPGSATEEGTRCAFSTDLRANYAPPTMSFRCCMNAPGANDGTADAGH